MVSQRINRFKFLVLVPCLALLVFMSRDVNGQDSDLPTDDTPEINSSLVGALSFRGIGPALMSGRISDIAVDPENSSTWYVAAASGGVWKTTNSGVTWNPIFDDYGSYSIGCLAIDPHDRLTVWVGTGENNSQRSVAYGDGLYKSTNGGSSFERVGFESSEHIGKIVVHPDDSQTVFVAAQGPLWRAGGDRGLYKTTDGGETWNKVLETSEHTGVNEVLMDPSNPQIMYASTYQRRRHTWVLIDGGPESTIYKSKDGGENWYRSDAGLPGVDKGKIGLAISPINPDYVYAIVEAAEGKSGFYRSTNRGISWQRMSSHSSASPQYYNEIVACPHKLDRVYSLSTFLEVSEDGGKSFSNLGESAKHVDNHALIIDPNDQNHLIIGCDGGVYETWDRGRHYDYKANLPITQFYKVALSNEKPFYHVYGGTQDNNTLGGPSRTTGSTGIANSDWIITVGGDGFDPAVDPEDPDTIYSQWQYGGLVRFDRRSGLSVDIKPQPAQGGESLRWNWDSALMISPHDSKRIYYGSQILFRSDDRGDNWRPVSGDLSRNIDRNQLKVMGRIWEVDAVAKNHSTSLYGTIVSVSESPLVEGLIYVGTDDGMLQVSEDDGESWRAVGKFGTLDVPEFGYINDVEADLHDPDTVYVAVNNHKRGDFKPYVVKSTDRGNTWVEITSNLPERGSVYTLKQDHKNANLLFCGTEFGCFCSMDGGAKWTALASGLPTIAIRDIEIQADHDDLVLASFGRGFFIMDDYSPLRELTPETSEENKIFPIRKGLMYGRSSVTSSFLGASHYVAPNPEYGVTFTYHLKDTLRTKKSERKSKDSKAKSAGEDAPYPSWDELKAEDREFAPKRFLTIRDSDGNAVARLDGNTSAGMGRIRWNYRHQVGGGAAAIAVPGTYTVDVSEMVNGAVTQLVEPVAFEIEPLGFENMSEPDRAEIVAFAKQTGKLAEAVSAAKSQASDAKQQLTEMEQAVLDLPGSDLSLLNDIRAVTTKYLDVMEKFDGDPTKTKRSESAYPGFISRLNNLFYNGIGSFQGPTGTHRSQYEIVEAEFDEALTVLKEILATDLPALHQQMEEAGLPWTKGRPIPDWK